MWKRNITNLDAQGTFRSLNGAADESIFQGRASKAVFFASTFWTKLQNIFGHCCMSKLDKVAKPWLAMIRPAI